MKRAALGTLTALAAVCTAMIVGGPAAAIAATHSFDPVLSLTGDCSTSVADTVSDPGTCPIPPGVPGVDHPPAPFAHPQAVTADTYGNLYIASAPGGEGSESRVDIFNPSGLYITTVKIADLWQIAVDGDGVLYVVQVNSSGDTTLARIKPVDPYEPATGEITYPDPATLEVLRDSEEFLGNTSAAIATNPADNHLFLKLGVQIFEYGSAEEGNPVLDEFGNGVVTENAGRSIAIDASRGRIYASAFPGGTEGGVVRVLELAAPHALLDTITASETPIPSKKFQLQPSIAVDEGTGNVFVYNAGELAAPEKANLVYEFNEEGEYLSNFGQGTSTGEGKIEDVGGALKIWVDNGAQSPNGKLNDPDGGRYLFVPSHKTSPGHLFAYGPSKEAAAEVKSVEFDEVSRSDAELRATINPGSLATNYVFEYITEQQYEEEGETFAGAEVAGEGQISAGVADVTVSAVATGLTPETAYRFRVVATNSIPPADSMEGQFTTYPSAPSIPACSNDALRTGPSALLHDCRAYELVTPPDTNARTPLGLSQLGLYFPSLEASPAGDRVSFQIQGGTIPGYEGTGSLAGDPYLSSRTDSGWKTAAAGPNGDETQALLPGSTSPDQGYSIWGTANPTGTKVIGGQQTNYVRYPDGHSALVGRGILATDPRAEAHLISADGGHIIFVSGTTSSPAVRLEPNSPPAGTRTIYDRTADEVTHVVSLLPGNAIPSGGQNAEYQGASYDGKGIAFTIGANLYLRYDNKETFAVGNGVTFAGVAEGGRRIFYLQGGNLKAFEIEKGIITFTTSGNVTPVNVAAGGTAAYFISPSVLGSSSNPNGAEPVPGEENVYLSREGQISFVGTVTEQDAEGEAEGTGLGRWIDSIARARPGFEASRTTPDGSVLLFESRAPLDDYDPDGHVQVYRYDFDEGELDCLSCNPTGSPAIGEASLQSLNIELGDIEPLSASNRLTNLRADGRRAFFQSEEALVPEDTDGLQDVYEWEDQGVGSCSRPQGCTFLISSGHSERVDYLFAVSDSGGDVFFRSSDLLTGADTDETPSIYDARVGGGFPEVGVDPCQKAQICKPNVTPPPALPNPASGAVGASGNLSPKKSCPKGKHKVKRGGKVRCVKKKQHRHHRAGTTKKGGHQ
jgi:hypothetical protein